MVIFLKNPYLSIQPLRIPSLKNSQTTQKTLTSTLSESLSSLRSIPFSTIGNTHTLSLSLSLFLTHTLCTVSVCNDFL